MQEQKDKLENSGSVVEGLLILAKGVNAFSEKVNKKVLILHKVLNFYGKKLYDTLKEIDMTGAICSQELVGIEWPPCIDLSEGEKDKICDLLKDDNKNEENINKAIGIILNSYNNHKLTEIEKRWEECPWICKNRLSILSEAIDNYKSGRFYSCVALLTCQYGGIIKEVNKYLEYNPKIKLAMDEIKEEQRQEYRQKYPEINSKKLRKDLKSEKNLSEQQQLAIVHYTTALFNEYFKENIYGNNAKVNNPNRNKICHGQDVYFGTKEKALKGIICIDSLIRLYILMDKYNDEET